MINRNDMIDVNNMINSNDKIDGDNTTAYAGIVTGESPHYSPQIMSTYGYSITNWMNSLPQNDQFKLHWHDEYEIFLFLRGDAAYIVNEKIYNLEPLDIILIRKHEMHRIIHSSNTQYQRCVLMVSPAFFQKYDCQEYEMQFLNTSTGIDNKIPGEIVRSSGLYDAFLRYKKYSETLDEPVGSPLSRSIITEILYLLNKNTGFSKSDHVHGPIKSVLRYLNNNYTEDISLDMLSEKFFLSKYHLCRIFRKTTGLTVHEYICRKRLALIHELREDGMSLNEAAEAAGFRDYSSFYRAFVKEYGSSPRKGM